MISELCVLHQLKITSDLEELIDQIYANCPEAPNQRSSRMHIEDQKMLEDDPYLKGEQQSTQITSVNLSFNHPDHIGGVLAQAPEEYTQSSQSQPYDLSSEISSSSRRRPPGARRRLPRPRRQPTNPYPTKNFLQTFRGFFLKYLCKFFSVKAFQQIPIIHKILGKKSINLKNFQDLLNTPAFRVYLEIYFEEGLIYEDLKKSRVKPEVKKHYESRVYVFEKGFRTGKFTKINQNNRESRYNHQ